MIYQIKNNRLQNVASDCTLDLIVPNDIYDIRNMAITLLYPENIEQILRNKYLKEHIKYLHPLYKESLLMKKNIDYPLQPDSYNHFQYDLVASKKGNAVIYSSDPNNQNLHQYVFYLLEILTSFQKDFLYSNMKSFLKLQQMTLFIYKEAQQAFDYPSSMEEYRTLSSYQTLKKMIQNKESLYFT